MKMKTILASLAVAAIAAVGSLSVWSGRGHAADHLDPPARTDPMMGGMDRNGDIADVYTWHRDVAGGTRNLVTILSFAGPNAPVANQRIPCDRDVLYALHYDNSNDGVADVTIYARLAPDDVTPTPNCFVQWSGIPGTAAPVVTAAETTRAIGSVKLFAGLRDDAFFFDLQGFRNTLMNAGNPATPAGVGADRGIQMISDRDFFAGKNTSALVIELPITSVLGSGTSVRVWATTARATM